MRSASWTNSATTSWIHKQLVPPRTVAASGRAASNPADVISHELGLAWSLKELVPLHVDTLPVGALDLHPVTAWAARIARGTAFGNDTFEPEFIAMAEQGLAVWKRLHLSKDGRVRLPAYSVEIALALS